MQRYSADMPRGTWHVPRAARLCRTGQRVPWTGRPALPAQLPATQGTLVCHKKQLVLLTAAGQRAQRSFADSAAQL